MKGVLVMSYGSPVNESEIEAFYTHIRRGHPPSTEQLEDLMSRYSDIGGVDQLRFATKRQGDAIASACPVGEVRVVVGYKHASPFIEDAAKELEDCSHVAGVVMAPHYSRASVGEYHHRAQAAVGDGYRGITSWWNVDSYVDWYAEQIERLATSASTVIFTAHSLPVRSVQNDPYREELQSAAQLIMTRSRMDVPWELGWQSAGRSGGEWLGPDVNDRIRELTRTGRNDFVVVPHGFTAEHLEVRHDLDIVLAATAREIGVRFDRAAVVGDEAGTMTALAAKLMELFE